MTRKVTKKVRREVVSFLASKPDWSREQARQSVPLMDENYVLWLYDQAQGVESGSEGEEDPKREEEQEEGGFALEQQTEQPQDQPGWKPQEQKPLKRPFLVHLTPEQHEKLAEIADASGESRASHVRQALNRYLFQR